MENFFDVGAADAAGCDFDEDFVVTDAAPGAPTEADRGARNGRPSGRRAWFWGRVPAWQRGAAWFASGS